MTFHYEKFEQGWADELIYGLNFDWNYKAGYVDMSMPGYIKNTLLEFQHAPTSTTQDDPSLWYHPTYGIKVQTMNISDS